MNLETIQRIKRIESAIATLQGALDNLQAQVTELKAPKVEPKRETLTLRKRSG